MAKQIKPAAGSLPDDNGHFGPYGGRFVAETLMVPLRELEEAYARYVQDEDFLNELDDDLRQFVGRPSPLYLAERWSEQLGGAQIYLKREDLNHTGAHKVNNTVGQALLAKRMGKTRIIAETGAASTAWPPPPWRRVSAWNAWSTWVRRTSGVRPSTSIV